MQDTTCHMSISLDGFVAGPEQSREDPLGKRGRELHGWHLGDHGMWCKHTNYEKATRAALVMHAPGQKAAGKATDALVEFVDIYPTLAEAYKVGSAAGAPDEVPNIVRDVVETLAGEIQRSLDF